MSSLRERLKAKSVKEKTVDVDGDKYLIRSIGRVEKTRLLERSGKGSKIDGVRFEAEYLAACVFDPETQQQVEPDWQQWDIPTYIADPLFEAVMEVNGNKSEKLVLAKNSEATES